MTSLSGITTISFDVDGTLWDFEGLTRRALREVLKELARIDPGAARRLDVERMVAIRNEIHDRLGIVTDLDAVREESMREALREAGGPTTRSAHTLPRSTSSGGTSCAPCSQMSGRRWSAEPPTTGSACCPTATVARRPLGSTTSCRSKSSHRTTAE